MLSRKSSRLIFFAPVAVAGAIAAFVLLAPHGGATKNRSGAVYAKPVAKPVELMKIKPAEADRDTTDWHPLVGG